MNRLAPILAVLILLSADAAAQPPGATAPEPPPIGHRSVLLGLGVTASGQAGGGQSDTGGTAGLEAFAGWAFGRWAVMAWARGRKRSDAGFFDLGVAGRAWLFRSLPRIYAELRAGRDVYSLSGEFSGDNTWYGAIVGGGLGLELVTSPGAAIDGRAMLERGITVDAEDFTLLSFALVVHVY